MLAIALVATLAVSVEAATEDQQWLTVDLKEEVYLKVDKPGMRLGLRLDSAAGGPATLNICNRSTEEAGTYVALNRSPNDLVHVTAYEIRPQQCRQHESVWGVNLGPFTGEGWTAQVMFD